VPGAAACAARAPRACAAPPAPRAALPWRHAHASAPLPQQSHRAARSRALRVVIASASAPSSRSSAPTDWAAVRADIADVIADPSVQPSHVGDKGPTLVRFNSRF
jgi:hypothetical protein